MLGGHSSACRVRLGGSWSLRLAADFHRLPVDPPLEAEAGFADAPRREAMAPAQEALSYGFWIT